MKSGIELIAEERERQVSQEGWTAEHDDQHLDGSISAAGAAYARVASTQQRMKVYAIPDGKPHDWGWLWSTRWWKPSSDPIKNLVRAGALIAAEIDRIQRQRDNQQTLSNDGRVSLP